jgi:hypothetical protein
VHANDRLLNCVLEDMDECEVVGIAADGVEDNVDKCEGKVWCTLAVATQM